MSFWRNNQAGAAVEYAIVFTMLMVLIFGAIDLGFMLFQWQGAVKAAQIGAREAVVMDRVASGLATFSGFVGTGTGQAVEGTPCMNTSTGGPIAACNFGTATCTNASCTCSNAGVTCGSVNSTSFNAILAQMQVVLPRLQASNVQIAYSSSGLGFVGFPLPATVTVTITGLNYQFFGLTAFETLFPTTIPIPPSPATLTGEDLKSS